MPGPLVAVRFVSSSFVAHLLMTVRASSPSRPSPAITRFSFVIRRFRGTIFSTAPDALRSFRTSTSTSAMAHGKLWQFLSEHAPENVTMYQADAIRRATVFPTSKATPPECPFLQWQAALTSL
uniref:Putative secreted protein n=1 Tax=Ixodes ricinus TaxID=34613 RepID=A0A6B0UNX4_IXORI